MNRNTSPLSTSPLSTSPPLHTSPSTQTSVPDLFGDFLQKLNTFGMSGLTTAKQLPAVGWLTGEIPSTAVSDDVISLQIASILVLSLSTASPPPPSDPSSSPAVFTPEPLEQQKPPLIVHVYTCMYMYMYVKECTCSVFAERIATYRPVCALSHSCIHTYQFCKCSVCPVHDIVHVHIYLHSCIYIHVSIASVLCT